jgi:hypothetical protein
MASLEIVNVVISGVVLVILLIIVIIIGVKLASMETMFHQLDLSSFLGPSGRNNSSSFTSVSNGSSALRNMK